MNFFYLHELKKFSWSAFMMHQGKRLIRTAQTALESVFSFYVIQVLHGESSSAGYWSGW